MNLSDFLSYASSLSVIPAAALAVVAWNRTSLPSMRYIELMMILGLFSEIGMFIMRSFSPGNMPILYVFSAVEVLLISLYWSHTHYLGKYRRFIMPLAGIIILVIAYDSYMNWGYFIQRSKTFASMILSSLALIQLFAWLRNPKSLKYYKSPDIYVALAIFIYFSMSATVFSMTGAEFISQNIQQNLWQLHSATNIIANLLFAGAIYMAAYKQ